MNARLVRDKVPIEFTWNLFKISDAAFIIIFPNYTKLLRNLLKWKSTKQCAMIVWSGKSLGHRLSATNCRWKREVMTQRTKIKQKERFLLQLYSQYMFLSNCNQGILFKSSACDEVSWLYTSPWIVKSSTIESIHVIQWTT